MECMARPAETIETLVSDVLVLTYNAIWSICLLTVRPIHTVHRLRVRLRSNRRLQVAPHTLLFLVLLLTTAAVSEKARQLPLPDLLKDSLYGGVPPAELKEFVVVALGLLVGLDVLVRSTALLFHRRDHRRKERFIQLALYLCAAQVLYLDVLLACGYLVERL